MAEAHNSDIRGDTYEYCCLKFHSRGEMVNFGHLAIQALGFHITENDMWEVSKTNYWPGRWTGEMFGEV